MAASSCDNLTDSISFITFCLIADGIFSLRIQKCPLYSWVYVRQYCAEIDEAARNRMELIVPELAKRNGVTEKLKADTKWNGYGR